MGNQLTPMQKKHKTPKLKKRISTTKRYTLPVNRELSTAAGANDGPAIEAAR